MSLPEKKVKELIDLMNSKSTASVPAAKPIIEMFNLAMDEKVLDYLLKAGQETHTVPQLEEIYYEMYGGDRDEWNEFWEKRIKRYSFFHPYEESNRETYELSPIFPGGLNLPLQVLLQRKEQPLSVSLWNSGRFSKS